MTTVTSRKDLTTLVACLGGAVASYQILKYLYSKRPTINKEWMPIGRIKCLYIYPIKSCKAIPVFSLYCDYLCGHSRELFDRKFLVTNSNGHFFTGRVKPQLILVEVDVRDGILYLSYQDEKAQIALGDIKEKNQIIKATLFRDERQDGFDCGEEAAQFFTKVVGEPARLVMHEPGLYTERKITTKEDWWNNNEVPKRTDDKPYADNTPYMVTTQASLDELNERLEEKIDNVQFRANIIVDGCPAWDEDRWAELRFGDRPDENGVEMQCYRPCDRCIMTTINPETGIRHQQEPLKSLREAMPLLKLDSGTQLEFIDEKTVQANLQERGFEHDTAFIQLGRSDLEPNQYEGGLKIWECTKILCDWLEKNMNRIQGKSLLELGCGGALPSILAVKLGATDVVAQDFNLSVINCFTLDNILANGLEKVSIQLIAKNWADISQTLSAKRFDIVISSETIYNPDNYESFHSSIEYTLKDQGIAWIVAKEFYFGLGGSVFAFMDFVKGKGVFHVKIVDPKEDETNRGDGYDKVIIELTRKLPP